MLDRYTKAVLFPDTPYRHESGGDPACIPDLTYEQFIAFHKNYYHPANSFIYLYGDMDMAEKLEWLDRAYLSQYDRTDFTLDSRIPMQEPFKEPIERETTYSVTAEEGTKGRTYLSLNTVVGNGSGSGALCGFQILEYALIDAPGAPLKQALIDAHIGQDILGRLRQRDPSALLFRNRQKCRAGAEGEFLAVVKGTLRRLADQGIDRKSLLAGLNYYEFRYREADYGSAPKGTYVRSLVYGQLAL